MGFCLQTWQAVPAQIYIKCKKFRHIYSLGADIEAEGGAELGIFWYMRLSWVEIFPRFKTWSFSVALSLSVYARGIAFSTRAKSSQVLSLEQNCWSGIKISSSVGARGGERHEKEERGDIKYNKQIGEIQLKRKLGMLISLHRVTKYVWSIFLLSSL